MLTPEQIAEQVADGLKARRGSVTGTERWAAEEGARLALQLVELEAIAQAERDEQADADHRARLGSAHACPSCGQPDQVLA